MSNNEKILNGVLKRHKSLKWQFPKTFVNFAVKKVNFAMKVLKLNNSEY